MIRRVVALTGTAIPTPTPATAVLIPTPPAWLAAGAPPQVPRVSAAAGRVPPPVQPAAAPPTTWALVSRNPSLVNTTPEPRLSPPRGGPGPPERDCGTRRLATFPVRCAATPATTWE